MQLHRPAPPTPLKQMDTLGIEPRAFRMQSGCDATTPCARMNREDAPGICNNPSLHTNQAQRAKPAPQCVAPTSNNSATRTRSRVARVRAEYPNQLDYSGPVKDTTCTLQKVFMNRAFPTANPNHTRARCIDAFVLTCVFVTMFVAEAAWNSLL